MWPHTSLYGNPLRRFESDANNKRQQKQLSEAAVKSLKAITSFLIEKMPQPLDSDHSDSDTSSSDDENFLPTNDISMPLPQNEKVINEDTEMPTVAMDTESTLNLETAQKENEDLGDAMQQEQELMTSTEHSVTTVASELDIGLLDENNVAQMQSFLRISFFQIPSNIPNDENHVFPTYLLIKPLPSGEICTRYWLCWSMEKQALYCICTLFHF
nr:uncharacterized protein LOC112547738 [Pelodiscus sinensis]|eukprot:XP_025046426.1 uncharacterized protein LOC112547738 [Pelodiscus sinensis]